MGKGTVLISLVVLLSTVEMGFGRMIPVGARMKVKDVETNQEIQDLGRYSVNQYNLRQQVFSMEGDNGINGELKFKEVVEAEKQVVSGIKYYLMIHTKSLEGVHLMFDAVVLVKPWTQSKELLHFGSSPSHATE